MESQLLRKEADGLQDKLVSDRRYLHTHPGTGFDIKDTVEYVKHELESMGYKPIECGKAGLVALAGGKKPDRGRSYLWQWLSDTGQ